MSQTSRFLSNIVSGVVSWIIALSLLALWFIAWIMVAGGDSFPLALFLCPVYLYVLNGIRKAWREAKEAPKNRGR